MATRRRASLGLLPALVIASAWLLVPATAVAGDPCYHGFDMPAREDVATTVVTLQACAFSPTIARIPVGGTVTFSNGEFVHLITGANQAWGDRDVEVRPRTRVTYTFDEAGIYPYACALHRGMSGAIVVGAAQTAAEAAPVAASEPAPPAGPDALPVIGALVALAAGLAGAALVVAARRRTGAAAAGDGATTAS